MTQKLFDPHDYIDDLWNTVNIVYELWDEGYIDDDFNLYPDTDVEKFVGTSKSIIEDMVGEVKEYMHCLHKIRGDE